MDYYLGGNENFLFVGPHGGTAQQTRIKLKLSIFSIRVSSKGKMENQVSSVSFKLLAAVVCSSKIKPESGVYLNTDEIYSS